MTDFSDFKAQIAEYANRQDWADALVTGFVRQVEQKLNSELRVDRMIKTSQNLITCRCATLPDDWLQMDLVKIQNDNGADGFLPIRYKSARRVLQSPRQLGLWLLHNRGPGHHLRRARPMRSMASPT